MTNQDIIRIVQSFFAAPDITTDSTKLLNSDNTNSAVAVRMINAYQRFMSRQNAENQIEFVKSEPFRINDKPFQRQHLR